MQNTNQSEPTSKIPWHKTPAGKAYYQANREKAKARTKAWREANPEKAQVQNKAHYRANREKRLDQTKVHYQANREKAKARTKAWREANPEKAQVHSKAWYEANCEKAKDRAKVYYQSNPEKRQSSEYKAKQKAYKQTSEYKAKQKVYQESSESKARRKAWREANPEKASVANKVSHEKRLKEDPLYRAKTKLRNAVSHSFQRISKNKPANTQTLLGCSWEQAKAHFESLFKEGMSWENHGEWHIDHIRPVASFSETELHLMNHISNLQPLWAHENWEKSDKVL